MAFVGIGLKILKQGIGNKNNMIKRFNGFCISLIEINRIEMNRRRREGSYNVYYNEISNLVTMKLVTWLQYGK